MYFVTDGMHARLKIFHIKKYHNRYMQACLFSKTNLSNEFGMLPFTCVRQVAGICFQNFWFRMIGLYILFHFSLVEINRLEIEKVLINSNGCLNKKNKDEKGKYFGAPLDAPITI